MYDVRSLHQVTRSSGHPSPSVAIPHKVTMDQRFTGACRCCDDELQSAVCPSQQRRATWHGVWSLTGSVPRWCAIKAVLSHSPVSPLSVTFAVHQQSRPPRSASPHPFDPASPPRWEALTPARGVHRVAHPCPGPPVERLHRLRDGAKGPVRDRDRFSIRFPSFPLVAGAGGTPVPL